MGGAALAQEPFLLLQVLYQQVLGAAVARGERALDYTDTGRVTGKGTATDARSSAQCCCDLAAEFAVVAKVVDPLPRLEVHPVERLRHPPHVSPVEVPVVVLLPHLRQSVGQAKVRGGTTSSAPCSPASQQAHTVGLS